MVIKIIPRILARRARVVDSRVSALGAECTHSHRALPGDIKRTAADFGQRITIPDRTAGPVTIKKHAASPCASVWVANQRAFFIVPNQRRADAKSF